MDQPAPPPVSPAPPGPIDPLRLARLERFLPIAILIGLPCILVFWAVNAGQMLYGDDMVRGSYHIRALVGREFSEGRLATWDPYSMCGFPLMAALQAGVFYPLTWPILFLGPGAFWTFTVLIHLILAGLFAYGWLKEGLSITPWAALIGALVTMLSGYLLTHVYAGHISQISAYPWLAALLWQTERLLLRPTLGRWTLLALAMALMILPGFPHCVFFGGLLLGVRLLLHVFQKPEGRAHRVKISAAAAGAVILGALFAAPQLLPSMELIPRTQRVSINTYGFATTFSLPPENLVTLLLPGFFGGGGGGVPYWGQGFFWEISGFVGLGSLALGFLALGGRHPQRFLWAGVAAAAIVLALGRHTFLFKIFYYAVPGASLFRAPGRYLALFTLAVSALAALGFDRWWKEEEGVRRATLKTGIAAGSLLAAVLLCLLAASWSGGAQSNLWQGILAGEEAGSDSSLAEMRKKIPGFQEKAHDGARKSLAWAAISLGIVSAGLLAHARGAVRGKAGAAVVGSFLIIELLAYGTRFLEGVPEKDLAWPPEFVDFVKKAPGGPFRIASPGMKNVQHVGRCQVAGIFHVSGYESMLLRNYTELINAVAGRPAEMATVMATITGPDPVLDMLGVRFWLLSKGMPLPPGWRKIAWIEDCEVFESPRAFPRAFLVPKAVVIPARDERLRYLTSETTDLRKVVVLETAPPASAVPKEGELGSASVVSLGPGRYEIAAETASGGYLVLTESEYPGWEARVDGTPVEILRANHFVQSVWLPPGKHTVRFEYHSRRLGLGFLLCLLAAAVPAGLAVLARRRSVRKG